MKEYKPYCYLIGWSKLDKWYYGSEYGYRSKIANPSNLWTTYFTSSKYVRKFIQANGNPDIIEIRKICLTDKETIFWEYRVLRKLKVKNNIKWLNKNEGKAPVGIEWSEDQKKKRSDQVSGKNNPMFGKKHTDETKILISKKSGKISIKNGMYGKQHTTLSKNKMSKNHHHLKTMLGKSHSIHTKEKMSKSHNPKVFTYNHPTHGQINATMRQMISLYPELKLSGLKALSSNKLKTYKDWYLYINPIF